jgi:hypothetical membrane protein
MNRRSWVSTAASLRSLAICGLLATVVVNGAFLIEGGRRPGYDSVRQYVSELSLGPDGWAQKAAFTLGGLLILGAARALHHALDGANRRWNRSAKWMAAAGICLVLVGLFDTDPLPSAVFTASGLLHDVFAFLFFVSLVGAMSSQARCNTDTQTWRRFSALAALLTLVLFVLVMIAFPFPGKPRAWNIPILVAHAGLVQRLGQGIFFVWLIAMSLRALVLRRAFRRFAAPGRISPRGTNS